MRPALAAREKLVPTNAERRERRDGKFAAFNRFSNATRVVVALCERLARPAVTSAHPQHAVALSTISLAVVL